MDRLLTILTVAVVLGVAAVYAPRLMKSHQRANEAAESAPTLLPPVPENPEAGIQVAPTQPVQPGQVPAPLPTPTTALAARRLDLPMPKSLKEILDSPRAYKAPQLATGRRDFDMNTLYRGFYQIEGGKVRRVELDSRDRHEHKVQIELPDSKMREWKSEKAEMDVYNFNGDPYSLVLDLAGGKVLYLKFHTGRPVPGYDEPNFRVMRGWLFEGKSVWPVAMIDALMTELHDARNKGNFIWPVADTCQKLMPAAL